MAEEIADKMPPAVTGVLDAADVLRKMETAVKPEVLENFKRQHPAKFWLFGEDRQLAVRRNIIPAHWFEDGAKQFQQFSGVARPGEFYVFQVGLVPGEMTAPLDCRVMFESLKGADVNRSFRHGLQQRQERRTQASTSGILTTGGCRMIP